MYPKTVIFSLFYFLDWLRRTCNNALRGAAKNVSPLQSHLSTEITIFAFD
jgi:Na+-driven multidrug efflux pump